MARLNILFLMEDLCYGGTQCQMLELARRLDRARFAPSMLTLTGETDLDDVALGGQIDLHHLGKGRHVAPLFFLTLPGMLRRLRPDVLVPCTALPNIWGRLWGRAVGVPVIIGTCRGGGGPKRQYERILWHLADYMVCNSTALFDRLCQLGVRAESLAYIPNGVDTSFFAPATPPPSERQPVILCVARLAGDKDHLTLFAAFEEILSEIPEARLRIVGDGPEEMRLKLWARRHPAGAGIDFVAGSHDMRGHYAAAAVFALSSIREGQPNVILEAMSCGLPVCATKVGGIPNLVDEGKSGYLSPPGDAHALAQNCLRLLRAPGSRDAFGRYARARIEREFSFAAMVASHERLFETCWQKRRGKQIHRTGRA